MASNKQSSDKGSLKGKKLWQLLPNPCGGRPPLYTDPADLWNDFLRYCQWVDENPWEEKIATNALNSDDFGTDEKGKKRTGNKKNYMRQGIKVLPRAWTLYGFASFSGIYQWSSFKAKYKLKDGFSTVIHAIENSIKSQQVDGALVRQFDSNLVARLNGIADVTKQEITGKDGEPFQFPKLSDEDLKKIAALNEK